MSNQLAVVDDFGKYLDQQRDDIARAMPQFVDPDRWFRIALACFGASEMVQQCSPMSVKQSLFDAATLGLELGGPLGQSYLVPFKGKCTLVVGYKGMKELVNQSPQVAGAYWEIVRPGDDYKVRLGTDPEISHTPCGDAADPDDFTHVYAVGKTVGGVIVAKSMSHAQVIAHRNKYVKRWEKPGSAWLTAFPAMAMKTVALRVMRQLPLSVVAARVVEQSVYAESPAADTPEALPDGSVTPPETLDDVAAALENKAPVMPASWQPSHEELAAIRERELEESKKDGLF
jgi:recombination protein RecT